MSSTYQPSLDQIRRAVEISEHILRLQKDLERTLASLQQEQRTQTHPAAQVINSFNNLSQPTTTQRSERNLSRDARERIAAAQRRRWDKVRSSKAGLSS